MVFCCFLQLDSGACNKRKRSALSKKKKAKKKVYTFLFLFFGCLKDFFHLSRSLIPD